MCLCPVYFLLPVVPVVPGGGAAAGQRTGNGPVPPPGRQTVRRLRGAVHPRLLPGQILTGMCCSVTPPQRGRTTAEKILAIYAFRALKSPLFRDFSGMVGEVVGGFIIYPAKRCSKCVEMGKKESHQTQQTFWYLCLVAS